MSVVWTVYAGGMAPDQGTADKLAAELGDVLARAEYGTAMSGMRTDRSGAVGQPLHLPDLAAADR